MKIALIYSPFFLQYTHPAGFNFPNLWDDMGGLTGSELGFFRTSVEMAKRGHEVHIYTASDGSFPQRWDGLFPHPFEEIGRIDPSFDAVISWNSTEVLKFICDGPLRVVSFQVNGFSLCSVGFQNYVDLYASPSVSHRDRMVGMPHHIDSTNPAHLMYQVENPSAWIVIPNGCDPWRYDRILSTSQKISGRVIWASSPDRGLHWLLQEWPKIKRAVSHATLRIFYRFKPWADHIINSPGGDSGIIEQRSRAIYICEALRRLSNHGVELVDSVSRNQIDHEIAVSEVMAYSCDPVVWTEGFSITLLEACAAQSCPVTTAVDALPDVYGGVIPMVEMPLTDHISEFSDLVVRALTDSEFRGSVNIKARYLADSHTWSHVAMLYDQVISDRRSKA